MSVRRKVTDDQIREAYALFGSVHEAGVALGINGSSVHERAVKLGIVKPMNVFTEDERVRLVHEYALYRRLGKLDDLAKAMGRTKPFICRQARALGLTSPKHTKPWLAVWKYLSPEASRLILEDFRASGKTVASFCRSRRFDDLGFSRKMAELFPAEYEAICEANQPATSAYARGRSFEYAVKKVLSRAGYFVLRSPQSRSPTDLVAVAKGSILFVQCRIAGVIGVADWNALYDLSTSVGAAPVLAWREGAASTRFAVMTARKDGSRSRQPMIPFDPKGPVSMEAT